jgi:PAS domain S-box-containing protein
MPVAIDENTAVDGVEQVLLVDDNPINLQILYKTLEKTGYRLLKAGDGATALEIAKKARPSLILLDIMMPDMDGYDVCAKLKSQPETRNIAVIFLSALEDSAAKVRGFTVGGVDYISKPFQADEVIARVRNQIKIHRLERQLARRNVELEAENHQILNAISEGIISLDRDGRVSLFNPAATVITGWAASDVLGEQLSVLGLFDVDEGSPVEEHLSLPYRSYHSGIPAHSDMELIRCRNNKILPVAIMCNPRAEGGAVIVLRDISEWMDSEERLRLVREDAEAQRQHVAHMERLSTMGEMVAGIAHEVNQPLTAVANYSRVAHRLLNAEEPDKKILSELLEKIDAQVVRASEVVQRVRNFVKKPDGSIMLVDPNSVMREVIDLAEVDSRINDVGIHFEADDNLPAIPMDVLRVQQVALNLIRNAIESMVAAGNTQQGVVVTTELVGGQIYFTVIDQGIGIAEGEELKVFDQFYSTKPNGMGIGLSICQSIVHSLGGKIGFKRNTGQGASFYFSLPVA